MAVSNLPTRKEIHQPLLDLLSDGKEHRWRDIVEKLADHFPLTDKELNERVPSGYKRFSHRCSFAMQDLKAEGLVESTRREYWKITKRGNDHQSRQTRITPREKETRESTQRAPSETPFPHVSKGLHVPNPITRDSMKDKKPRIRTRSRRRSYGKKLAERPGQKQRAMVSARIREVKPIEKVIPTEKKTSSRAPRKKHRYTRRIRNNGFIAFCFLLASFIFYDISNWASFCLSVPGVIGTIFAVKDYFLMEKERLHREPRSQDQIALYTRRTVSGGCVTSFSLLASFVILSTGVFSIGVFFLFFGLLGAALTVKDYYRSGRG